MTGARVCVVTSGHLATCPRMVKAADALHGAGYEVHVVSCRFEPWAAAADLELRRAPWAWSVVPYDRASAPAKYVTSGVRRHATRFVADACGADRIPFPIAARAFSRMHTELIAAIETTRPDLVYAGTAGALAAAAEAAARCGVPYALDLEDLHNSERDVIDGALDNRLAVQIEQRVLKGAAALTASSPLIAEAYRSAYAVEPVVVHNTFPLPSTPRPAPVARALRLCWFSQSIGPGRGLEDVITAAGGLEADVELALRGQPCAGYLDALLALQRQVAPNLAITLFPPGPPDTLVSFCAAADVGLSPEQPTNRNRLLCLGNKIFTYLIAGRPVVLTDTPAHRLLAADLGNATLVYPAGDATALGNGLKRWTRDRAALARAQAAAWSAAERRWHWEHPLDRGALVAAVAGTLCAPIASTA